MKKPKPIVQQVADAMAKTAEMSMEATQAFIDMAMPAKPETVVSPPEKPTRPAKKIARKQAVAKKKKPAKKKARRVRKSAPRTAAKKKTKGARMARKKRR